MMYRPAPGAAVSRQENGRVVTKVHHVEDLRFNTKVFIASICLVVFLVTCVLVGAWAGINGFSQQLMKWGVLIGFGAVWACLYYLYRKKWLRFDMSYRASGGELVVCAGGKEYVFSSEDYKIEYANVVGSLSRKATDSACVCLVLPFEKRLLLAFGDKEFIKKYFHSLTQLMPLAQTFDNGSVRRNIAGNLIL